VRQLRVAVAVSVNRHALAIPQCRSWRTRRVQRDVRFPRPRTLDVLATEVSGKPSTATEKIDEQGIRLVKPCRRGDLNSGPCRLVHCRLVAISPAQTSFLVLCDARS